MNLKTIKPGQTFKVQGLTKDDLRIYKAISLKRVELVKSSEYQLKMDDSHRKGINNRFIDIEPKWYETRGFKFNEGGNNESNTRI